jgi:hypothetical protein
MTRKRDEERRFVFLYEAIRISLTDENYVKPGVAPYWGLAHFCFLWSRPDLPTLVPGEMVAAGRKKNRGKEGNPLLHDTIVRTSLLPCLCLLDEVLEEMACEWFECLGFELIFLNLIVIGQLNWTFFSYKYKVILQICDVIVVLLARHQEEQLQRGPTA